MILNLIKFEFTISNRSHHLIRSIIYMMLLSLLLFSLTIPKEVLSTQIKMLICFAGLIFTSMIVPPYQVKADLKDGFLETIMTICTPFQIIFAKYISIVFNMLISTIILLPIIMLLFQIPKNELIYLYFLMMLTIMQISIILIFVNILHAYFKRNTNLLISLMLPVILPTIMIASLAIRSMNNDFLMVLLGIDLIFIPITFYLSTYLLKNLFNI